RNPSMVAGPPVLTTRAPPTPPVITQTPAPLPLPCSVFPWRSTVTPGDPLGTRTIRPSAGQTPSSTGSSPSERLLTPVSPQAQGTSCPPTLSPQSLAPTPTGASSTATDSRMNVARDFTEQVPRGAKMSPEPSIHVARLRRDGRSAFPSQSHESGL